MMTIDTERRAASIQNGLAYSKRGINQERLQAIRRHAGATILDAGCGNGQYVLHLANEFDIRGVDWQSFESWKAQPDRFIMQDLVSTSYPSNSVETVLSFEVLEHIPQPLALLRQLHNICTKNLILTVPNCDITPGMRSSLLTYYHYVDPTHVNFFTMQTIVDLCRQAGFGHFTTSYINRVDLSHLVRESFDCSGVIGNFILNRILQRPLREHHITCLVVCHKEPAD